MNQYYASPDCLALGSKATVCGLQVGPRLADIGTTAAVVTLAGSTGRLQPAHFKPMLGLVPAAVNCFVFVGRSVAPDIVS